MPTVARGWSGEVDDAEALRLAAAVERDSEHPIAQALLRSAEEQALDVPRAEDFQAVPGHGVQATVAGRELKVGGPALLRKLGIEPPADLRAAAERFGRSGQAAIYLVEGERVLAAFAIADAIRPESFEAVRRLHEEGIEVAMLTGDHRRWRTASPRSSGSIPCSPRCFRRTRPRRSGSCRAGASAWPWWATA